LLARVFISRVYWTKLVTHYSHKIEQEENTNNNITMKVKSITARFLSAKRGKIKFEDELSSSSTHTVDSDSQKNKAPSTRRRPRIVCVDESHNILHEVEAVTSQEECLARWYTEEENAKMKEANNFTCKMVCRLSNDSYTSALTVAYQACAQGNLNEEQLREQVQQWAARTGLEHRCVKGASKDKQRRREALLSLAYNLTHENTHLSTAQVQELMAQECQAITEQAARFALAVGRAQA
jgi:hypothetical protein